MEEPFQRTSTSNDLERDNLLAAEAAYALGYALEMLGDGAKATAAYEHALLIDRAHAKARREERLALLEWDLDRLPASAGGPRGSPLGWCGRRRSACRHPRTLGGLGGRPPASALEPVVTAARAMHTVVSHQR